MKSQYITTHCFYFLTTVLVTCVTIVACEGPMGPQGEQGIEGPQGLSGKNGNANVMTFDFTVSAADWGQNAHYGAHNNFRNYRIPPDSVGGIRVSSFFQNGGAIVLYAKVDHGPVNIVGSFGGWKNLPLMYRSPDDIGIKIVFHVSRSDVAITQTTNGWDHIGIMEEHLPDKVDFRIVFVENTSLNLISESGVDIGDYASFNEYLGIIIDKSPQNIFRGSSE